VKPLSLLFLIPVVAMGAISSQTTVKLYQLQRSGINVSPGPKSFSECVASKAALIKADSDRVSGSATYKCYEIEQTVVKFKAAPKTGSSFLSWKAPTSYAEDGSSITDLAGYRILYGKDPNSLSQIIQVSSASITTYVVDGLDSGKWYFAVRAYTSAGKESENSALASKIIG